MNTAVIILAQGEQRRLPDLKVPKQLLTLDYNKRSIPILVRTLKQLRILRGAEAEVPTVIGGPAIDLFLQECLGSGVVRTVALPDPGNSSLKGVSRCLHLDGDELRPPLGPGTTRPVSRVVVLLGDVVYSWACMRWLLDTTMHGRFVTSTGLNQSEGEVWGISWDVAKASTAMRLTLIDALEKHPPFEEYQPGQMRHWLFASTKRIVLGQHVGWTEIPRGEIDYTMDVDTPKDLPLLAKVAPDAYADDEREGLQW